jgi:hypothetical protein
MARLAVATEHRRIGATVRAPSDLGLHVGAGEGNRTLMTSLEGWGSAIELRPRVPGWRCLRHRVSIDSVPVSRSDRRGAHHVRKRDAAGPDQWEGRLRFGSTGCGAAWLARLLWEQEAAGSNPAIPTVQRLADGC